MADAAPVLGKINCLVKTSGVKKLGLKRTFRN
jgi:hypothetical protein